MRRRLHTSGSLGISQCIAGLPGNAHLLYACAELSCVNSPLPFLPPLPLPLPICQQTHLQPLGLHGRGQAGGTDIRLSTISSIPWGNIWQWHGLSHGSCDSCSTLLQYLVSIPLLMLRPWAFVAMISQVSSHDSHVTSLTPRACLVSSPDQRVHLAFLHYKWYKVQHGPSSSSCVGGEGEGKAVLVSYLH